jgi:alpha-D-ribose 1-methylphosphonate 5-phosphate C-P lyase
MKHTYQITVQKTIVLDVDEPEPELNNPEVNKIDALEIFKDALELNTPTSEGVSIVEM